MPLGRLIEQYAACFRDRLFLCRLCRGMAEAAGEEVPALLRKGIQMIFIFLLYIGFVAMMKGGERECW